MDNGDVLIKHLILSRKNVKQKIMKLKRRVIESDNYFRETFKTIIELLKSNNEKK